MGRDRKDGKGKKSYKLKLLRERINLGKTEGWGEIGSSPSPQAYTIKRGQGYGHLARGLGLPLNSNTIRALRAAIKQETGGTMLHPGMTIEFGSAYKPTFTEPPQRMVPLSAMEPDPSPRKTRVHPLDWTMKPAPPVPESDETFPGTGWDVDPDTGELVYLPDIPQGPEPLPEPAPPVPGSDETLSGQSPLSQRTLQQYLPEPQPQQLNPGWEDYIPPQYESPYGPSPVAPLQENKQQIVDKIVDILVEYLIDK